MIFRSTLKRPRLVAERQGQFSSLLSPWERLGEGAWRAAKIAINVFCGALAKREANLRGLGYGG